ncbi:FHA domain-containing protein [Saxibacter everestensis]|uniref:FHA domain-containing protein n=1 Tax=Saxibacter everestensis TaxID=2909229 RepID=A0ABY8QRX3_9MICO|nr:FHA domain-containing protein [Brevibacteriaceae bacterium ZFBP1038]
MGELTVTALRLGLLVLMWVFVLSVAAVLRRDLFSARAPRKPRPSAEAPAEAPAPRSPQPAPPAAAAPPHRQLPPNTLVVTEGSLKGAVVALGTVPILIGRAPECTLVLSDDFSSSRHARIYPQHGQWFLEDLGSTNGTTLNNTPVTHNVPVAPGVPIRIGQTVLELRS